VHPQGGEKWGAKFTGEICKCTLRQLPESASPRQSKSPISEEIAGDLGGRRGYLGSFSVCFELLLGEEKCTPDKILAAPIVTVTV